MFRHEGHPPIKNINSFLGFRYEVKMSSGDRKGEARAQPLPENISDMETEANAPCFASAEELGLLASSDDERQLNQDPLADGAESSEETGSDSGDEESDQPVSPPQDADREGVPPP